MNQPLRLALNHLLVPHLPVADLLDLALALKVDAIELSATCVDAGSLAGVRTLCRDRGIRLLALHALHAFDIWDDERRRRALVLCGQARDCGAEGLVLRPVKDPADPRSRAERVRGLRTALSALAPMLREHGLFGFVEPLGFESCALRHKRDAVESIKGIGGLDVFRLVHDCRQHRLSGEQALFPELTAIVHASAGIAGPGIPADMADDAAQIRQLLAGGCSGHLAFAPPAEDGQGATDFRPLLAEHVRLLRGVARNGVEFCR